MSWEKEYDAKRALQDALQITKAIKYFDNHIEIINEIRELAEMHGIDEKELKYHINKVYEAKNDLESAIFNLVEPFEDAVRSAQFDDEEDLDEMSNINDRFEKDFADIFGDLGDKVKARKKSPDHGRTQAHQDKTKKIPRKDKYKDNYKKDMNESRRQSSIMEAITSEPYDQVMKKLKNRMTDLYGSDPTEEVYVLYINGKPEMKFAEKKDAVEMLGVVKDMGIKDYAFKKETRPLREELEKFDEGKKDACYRKVKSRYKVWPSAYASGALVKCRKVGASNWGNKSKKK